MINVIFDVDGVLIDTPHEQAWQAALKVLMLTEWRDIVGQTRYEPELFTNAVYQQYLAGRPRLDGARAVLEYFGVPDAEKLAPLYGARKQSMIDVLLKSGEFQPFADGVRLALALQARGVRLGVASSSKNANQFMERVPIETGGTLKDLFDANVCGRDVPHGKPAPDIFLLAASELHAAPANCIVIEDAPSGIQAARAGGMLGLGVARHNDEALLRGAAADLVVTNLDAVDVDQMIEGHLERKLAATSGGAAGDS